MVQFVPGGPQAGDIPLEDQMLEEDGAPAADPALAIELWEAYHRGWRDTLAARSSEFGLAWLRVIQLTRGDRVDCTCYPNGVLPGTYEGPQPWCDEHGQPSVAWAQGFRDGWGQAREMSILRGD